MKSNLKIVRLKGQGIIPYISDLAKLRIEIFKSYPYLYEGDLDYEKNYLQTYIDCPESVMILVFDDNKIVGASTAIPLEFGTSECKKTFINHKIDISRIFYLGESVLLPEYRGQHVYHNFFTEREAAAREYGSKTIAFCSIERDPNDSRCPKDFVPLDNAWRRFGYTKHPELRVYYEWIEVSEDAPSPKLLTFWLKNL